MRYNTSNFATTEMRWMILKSMLDDFPELKERAEAYLCPRITVGNSLRNHSDPEIKEITEKAINEFKQERNRGSTRHKRV